MIWLQSLHLQPRGRTTALADGALDLRSLLCMWERWPLSLRPGSACSSVHCPGPADAADLRQTHLMQPGTRPSSHGNRPRRAWQGTPGRHVPLGMRPGQPGRPAAAPCPPEPSLCRWAGAPASEPSVRVHGAAPAAVGRASGRPLPCRAPQRWPAVTPRAGRPSPPAERGQHAALTGVPPLRPPVPRLCLTPPSRPPCGPLSQTEEPRRAGKRPDARSPLSLQARALLCYAADRGALLVAGVEISTSPDLSRGQRAAGHLLPRAHALPCRLGFQPPRLREDQGGVLRALGTS